MRRRVLFLPLALLAAGVLGEVVVRVLELAPEITRIRVDLAHGEFESSDNPVLRYVPRPGSRGVSPQGLRDRVYSIEKPPGVYRVAVLGDSIAYGYCNDEEVLEVGDLFPEVLERTWADAPIPVEVVNLSVSGYDTAQEVECLAVKGLAMEPDLVLVAYCLNDDWPASGELDALEAQEGFDLPPEVRKSLFLRSHLFRRAYLSFRVAEEEVVGGPARTEPGFERLAALAGEHGFEVAIVVFPLFGQEEPYPWAEDHARVSALGERHGFPVLDLLEPFRVAGEGKLGAMQGRCNREHPDERGHAMAGKAVAAFLRAEGLVPDG